MSPPVYMEKEQQGFSVPSWVSASLILMVTGVMSKGLGIIREVLVAKYFGASGQVDAFTVAYSLPAVGGGIGVAVGMALVPQYRHLIAEGSGERGNQLIGSAVTLVSILSLLLMLPLCIMPFPLVKMIAPALSDSTAHQSAHLMRWLSLSILVYNLIYVLTAVYNASHYFKIPARGDLLFNVIIIPTLIIFSASFGIYALVLGVLLGMFLMLINLVVMLPKGGLQSFHITLHSADLKALRYSIPIFFYGIFIQSINMVKYYFASGLAEGSIATLYYAEWLTTPLVALIATSSAQGAYPTFATLYAEKRSSEIRDLFIQITKKLIIILVPCTVFLAILRKDIIRVILMRGAFDAVAVENTAAVFLFYAGGVIIAAMEVILMRISYALLDTVTPLISAGISVIAAIFMSYLLTPVFGIAGIALAMNLTYCVRILVQAFILRRKLGGMAISEMTRTFILSMMCAFLTILPVAILDNDQGLHVLRSLFLFFAFYCGVGFCIMRKEFEPVWRRLSYACRQQASLILQVRSRWR